MSALKIIITVIYCIVAIALDSCKDFAKKVDDYIVSFRQHDAEALAQRQSMLDFRGYDSKSYLLDFSCPRFGSASC